MAESVSEGKLDEHFPGMTSEAHPEIFDARAMLPQPAVLKPGQLPADKIREYFEKVGCLRLAVTNTCMYTINYSLVHIAKAIQYQMRLVTSNLQCLGRPI